MIIVRFKKKKKIIVFLSRISGTNSSMIETIFQLCTPYFEKPLTKSDFKLQTNYIHADLNEHFFNEKNAN
jgi:hypothetical protein